MGASLAGAIRVLGTMERGVLLSHCLSPRKADSALVCARSLIPETDDTKITEEVEKVSDRK
jgi:hypothetical protein